MDIGCGNSPRGDVNIDLFVDCNIYRSENDRINYKVIPDFIIADGQIMPFKDNVFDEVESCSVVEHVKDPAFFCREIWRVCKSGGEIFITAEHRFSRFPRFNVKEILCKLSATYFKTTFGEKNIISLSCGYGILGIPKVIYVRVRKP